MRDYSQPCIVLDVDGTICPTREEGQDYRDLPVYSDMLERIQDYRERGYYLIYHTGRNERTHEGNIGLITAHTVPVLMEWLRRNGVPFDEVRVGKPWPGLRGFYIDDRTVTPETFLGCTDEEILSGWVKPYRHR